MHACIHAQTDRNPHKNTYYACMCVGTTVTTQANTYILACPLLQHPCLISFPSCSLSYYSLPALLH